jgi:hypothetical protein
MAVAIGETGKCDAAQDLLTRFRCDAHPHMGKSALFHLKTDLSLATLR